MTPPVELTVEEIGEAHREDLRGSGGNIERVVRQLAEGYGVPANDLRRWVVRHGGVQR